MSHGLQASRANDVPQALDYFGQASAAAPGSGIPHFLIASEYAALGDVANAEAAFANAVLLAPDMPLARYQLGLLQFSSGRAALGLVTWQPLLNPSQAGPIDQALVCFVRGYAALAQNDFDLAVSHFEAGVTIDTGNPALVNDARKVIQRIRALLATQNANGSTASAQFATPVSVDEGLADDAQSTHVLLSNYQTSGPRH